MKILCKKPKKDIEVIVKKQKFLFGIKKEWARGSERVALRAGSQEIMLADSGEQIAMDLKIKGKKDNTWKYFKRKNLYFLYLLVIIPSHPSIF